MMIPGHDAEVVKKPMRLHPHRHKLQERTIFRYRDDSSPDTMIHRPGDEGEEEARGRRKQYRRRLDATGTALDSADLDDEKKSSYNHYSSQNSTTPNLLASSPSKQRDFQRNSAANNNAASLSGVRCFFILSKSLFLSFIVASIVLWEKLTLPIIYSSQKKSNINVKIEAFISTPPKSNFATPRVVLLSGLNGIVSLRSTELNTLQNSNITLEKEKKRKKPKPKFYDNKQPQFPVNVFEPEQCEPYANWQREYHPTCCQFHELDFQYLFDSEKIELVGLRGFWRLAWRLSPDNDDGLNVALKTLKFEHQYIPLLYEYSRVDAVAMEHLTSSPYVMNIYSSCGNNVITEYATAPLIHYVKRTNSFGKLLLARDIAHGLSHIHYSDPSSDNVTLVHNDLTGANVMMHGRTPKFNDFNLGMLMMWNKNQQRPCRFQCEMDNAQWRAPEEMKQSNGDSSKEPLTEKIDIYGLGGVFFKIITGLDPWLEYFNQYNQTYAESRVEEAKRRGEIPHFPVTLLSRKKKAALRPIYDSMVQCLQLNPQDRPTAKELYAYLQSEVEAYMEEARRKKEEKGNNATDNAIIMNTEINTNVSISESLSESLKD